MLEIIRGHANAIRGQLTATNADTGVSAPLTAGQMEAITKVALVLDATHFIESGTTGVALGAGKEFDCSVDPANAILVMSLGSVEALATMSGTYKDPHIDVWFSDVAEGTIPILIDITGPVIVK